MINNDNERLKKQIDELQNNIKVLSIKNNNLENENKNLNDNYNTLLSEQKILSDELTKLTNENQDMKQKIFNKDNEILLNQNNSTKLNDISNKYDLLNQNKKDLEKQINALTYELKNLNNEIYNYKNLNEQLNKEKDIYEKQISSQKEQLDKNSEIILKYETQLKTNQFIEGNLSEKNNMVNDMRTEILNLKEQIEKLKINNSNLEF